MMQKPFKKSDNYKTPDYLLKVFAGWFDPCPLNPNPKVNGLDLKWKNKTYVNPPYSNPLPWIEKAIQESKQGKTIVLLLKVDTSTKWYLKLIEAKAKIFFFHGRIKFDGKNPANFPSMLAILNTNGNDHASS